MPESKFQETLTDEIVAQATVVAVDAVILVMDAIGIKVSLSNAAKKGLITTIVVSIKSCKQTLSAILSFGSAWRLAKGDVFTQAWVVLQLLYGMKRDIVWAIVKGYIQGMSTSDWLTTGATLSVSLFANFTSEGCALLINLGLTLKSAVGFVGEVAKLMKLM